MPCIRPISDLRNNANEISDFCRQTREPVYITRNGTGDMVVLSIENPGRTCPGFIANIFLRKFFVTGWLKGLLILPCSHHRNSTELGEYLHDLIRLYSKLNVPEILRYLLMPSHKILFRVFSRTGKSAISDQSGGLPDPLW